MFVVRYPSTGAAGCTLARTFRWMPDAVRFATSKKTYLRRAYGPRLAAQVKIENAEEAR